MAYLLGTDEAGYGPNLGPLIVSGSLWQVPDEALQQDLYESLAEAVTDRRSVGSADSRLPIGDSKRLYQPGGGLGDLERGVFAVLGTTGETPRRWHGLWELLSGDSGAPHQSLPWYDDYSCRLPLEADPDEVSAASHRLGTALAAAGARFVALRSDAVFPARFNQLTHRLGSKGAALSQITLRLVAELLSRTGDSCVRITCDKHGGRSRYAQLLQEMFPETLIEVQGESRAASVYCWGPRAARREARFVTGGERYLPTALASMVSKYLRELAMRAFNQFWCDRLPGLRPTAGYPADAKRFRREIAPLQAQLGIDDALFWRER